MTHLSKTIAEVRKEALQIWLEYKQWKEEENIQVETIIQEADIFLAYIKDHFPASEYYYISDIIHFLDEYGPIHSVYDVFAWSWMLGYVSNELKALAMVYKFQKKSEGDNSPSDNSSNNFGMYVPKL